MGDDLRPGYKNRRRKRRGGRLRTVTVFISLFLVFLQMSVHTAAVNAEDMPEAHIEWLDDGFNYLAIGNSITIHKSCSFWWNEIGMAASDTDQDYFHIVSAYLKTGHPAFMSVPYNFAIWERTNRDRDMVLINLDHYLDPRLDLVTVQLGENADDLITFEDDYVSLISYIREKAPNARILVVADFWTMQNRNDMKIRASMAMGVEFVSLVGIANNEEYYCGLGSVVYDSEGNEHIVEHHDVAIHPGDNGMQAIADRIIHVLSYHEIGPAPIPVSAPEGRTVTYNGRVQTGVGEGTGYTLSGTTSASDVGTYTVTATLQNGFVWEDETTGEKEIIWRILPIAVEGVILNRTSASLMEGKTLSLKATVLPANATQKKVEWESSDTAVATVNASGLVTAGSAGTAAITVTTIDGRKTATCKVTVTAPVKTPDELTEEFIARAYSLILGRAPDTGGMRYWFGELKAKRIGGSQMCAHFLASKEFRDRKHTPDETVDIIYRVFFDRVADAEGKEYWKSMLDDGASETHLVHDMSESTEFKNICARYGITQGTVTLTENRDKNVKVTAFVSRCYKETLGRSGDADGLNYWTGALLERKIIPAKAVEQFVFSKEMTSKKLGNSDFVKMLYRLCMGRNFDQGGLDYWLAEMGKGKTRHQVLISFVNSSEFRNIVSSYGL